jgi:hypothetical protein
MRANGPTDTQTGRTQQSLFAILRMGLNINLNQVYLHNETIPNTQYFPQQCYLKSSIPSMLVILQKFILQDWGNYTDMFQGMGIYVVFASDVLLICWFGTQLTQYVRLYSLL